MRAEPVAYYRPRWKGEIEGYLANYLKRNLWKIARTHDFDDAMQEGYLVFAKVRNRYCGPGADRPLSQGAHFMALFKTSWKRRFLDLAGESTLVRESEQAMPSEYEFDPAGDLENDGYLATLLRQAPAEVRLVLTMFLSAPQELLQLATAHWKPGQRVDPTVNRMLGRPEGDELMGRFSDYFR